MTVIANVFTDMTLATPFDDAVHSLSLSAVNGDNAYGSFAVGTTTSGNEVGADSDIGVDPITVSIVDDDPGSGVEAAHIKLSLSNDFSGAVAGAALDIGTLIPFGSPVEVFYRWDNSTGGDTDTNLKLRITARKERAI